MYYLNCSISLLRLESLDLTACQLGVTQYVISFTSKTFQNKFAVNFVEVSVEKNLS